MVSPFCATSKDYNKKASSLNTKKTRIPFMQREKTAIIKLRRLGYSINNLSSFFGRSRSVIHRILKTYAAYTPAFRVELRKLPNRVRLLAAIKQRANMDFQINRWLPFVFGEVDKPP